MASSLGATSLEQRRWLVVGIALHNVLTPCLRDRINTEMTPFYQHLVRSFGLDKQTCSSFKKRISPSTLSLNYKSINNNSTARHPRDYDYRVKDEVSLAKLFMKPFMAQFKAFDSSFDTSAALAVLCEAFPFASVKLVAKDVRTKVRNEWAHCDFKTWTEGQYGTCFDLMEVLVTNLRFPPTEEAKILDGLKLWRTQGQDICFGKPLDDTLLQLIRNEVQQLSDSLNNHKEQDNRISAALNLLKSEFDGSVASLQQKQAEVENTCKELKQQQKMTKEEMTAKNKELESKVESLCKALEVKSASLQQDLDLLKNLSYSGDVIDTVFDAPEQTKWFTGREKEIENLEKCLPLKAFDELKMSAICGLGGCGKSTLATHFAWKRKQEYEGGVFWISMADDRKFENSVSDLALRLGIEANSFDFTLSKLLTWISRQTKPWLMVLDDVDQLNLSENMHMVLSGRWKRRAGGHILLTTRREPKEVRGSVDLELSCCVEVFSFSEEEAKKFLLVRCGAATAEEEEDVHELVHELGCLPLAIEQAGAHIKALQCSIKDYLYAYKIRRLQLLSQHPRAKPSWEYESKHRLAVHTTWLLNFEYVKKSPFGELASRFLQASAFFAPNEIEDELIICELLSTEKSCKFPLVKSQIVDILTKFSLFQRKSCKSLGLHRLVQEVIRDKMTIQETVASMLTAVKLLHTAFRGCPSPDEVLAYITSSEQEQPSAFLTNKSRFYLWSKLTIHASELQQHIQALLYQQNIEREVKTVILTHETARIIYENAVHLSVHGRQEEAKEAERFAFRIFDSCPNAEGITSKEDITNVFSHILPLSQVLQKTVLYSSRRPNECTELAGHVNEHSYVTDELRLQGNSLFKERRYKEAVDVYTKALESHEEGKHADPRLLNNRATAYLKLHNFQQCLQDSEEYIKILPTCWKGYTRKALALNGLELRFSALCSAAIAFYHDASCCHRYEAFANEFKDLDGQWALVDSSESLQRCLELFKFKDYLRKTVLLLKNGQYDLGNIKDVTNATVAALESSSGVTINCHEPEFHRTCFFQNIAFTAKKSFHVTPGGNVEFHKCSFRNCTPLQPVVLINSGSAKFVECAVKDSKGSGIGAGGPGSSLTLIKCDISGNGNRENGYAYGVRVFNKGRLLAHESHIYGNVRGIWIDEGPDSIFSAESAIITDCEIYDNKYEGAVVGGSTLHSHDFPMVTVRRNKIYHNGTFGFRSNWNINSILFENNTVFENLWWGVCVHNNSGGLYRDNEICNNKMGGIKIGSQAPGKPPCVVVNNFVHDNCGPAFDEGLRFAERNAFPEKFHPYFNRANERTLEEPWLIYNVTIPDMVMAEFSSNRCVENDHTKKNFKPAVIKAHCSFCFRCDFDRKLCKGCMTATYCGKKCQKLHWKKHKYTCKAIGQRNSVELKIPFSEGITVSTIHPSLQPSSPEYCPPPPIDGSRFIVKIQTSEEGFFGDVIDIRGFVSDEQDPYKARMMLYDRSRHVQFKLSCKPQLYHLIMECGVIGKMRNLTKKLYCWAAFKDPKTLRIFTHELPELQQW